MRRIRIAALLPFALPASAAAQEVCEHAFQSVRCLGVYGLFATLFTVPLGLAAWAVLALLIVWRRPERRMEALRAGAACVPLAFGTTLLASMIPYDGREEDVLGSLALLLGPAWLVTAGWVALAWRRLSRQGLARAGAVV